MNKIPLWGPDFWFGEKTKLQTRWMISQEHYQVEFPPWIPSSPSSYIHAMVEETCKCILWRAIVGIAPSADFDRVTISILCNEELSVWWELLGCAGQWVATVSYSIGIVGAARLWEEADLKDENLCQNCPTCLVWFVYSLLLPAREFPCCHMDLRSCVLWTFSNQTSCIWAYSLIKNIPALF